MRQKVPVKIAKKVPTAVGEVFKRFTETGFEIYLVGGGVRALLSGQAVVNADFTTNATPEEIQKLYPDSFYDNRFGTVGIPLETKRGKEVYEITTYRIEGGYSDRRRPDEVSWGKSLAEDLKRRELTISALVIGPAGDPKSWDGKSLELVDLFGGQEDFEKKLIRAVGDPRERFAEDALRMLRAVRLAAQLGFTIEEATFAAIKENADHLEKVSGERIRDEFLKILASSHPADGYRLLRNLGLAAVILPEMEITFGVEQKSPGRHHEHDVGTHSVLSLENCVPSDPIVRLAALIHDVGKAVTQGRDEKGAITFYNHEMAGAKATRRIAERLKLSKKDAQRLIILVRWHQFTVDERQTDSAIRRFIRHVGQENLEDILAVRTADRLGGGARETSWRLERFKKKLVGVQKQPFSVADLQVTGHDVMKILGIGPGPEVGRVLQALYEEVVAEVEGEVERTTPLEKNQRGSLLKRIGVVGHSFGYIPKA